MNGNYRESYTDRAWRQFGESLRRANEEFERSSKERYKAQQEDLWRRCARVTLSNTNGENSITVYGPPEYGCMAAYPLREYVLEQECRNHRVKRYEFRPYSTQRESYGIPITEPMARDDAYRAAYEKARGFATRHAEDIGATLEDLLKKTMIGKA